MTAKAVVGNVNLVDGVGEVLLQVEVDEGDLIITQDGVNVGVAVENVDAFIEAIQMAVKEAAK